MKEKYINIIPTIKGLVKLAMLLASDLAMTIDARKMRDRTDKTPREENPNLWPRCFLGNESCGFLLFRIGFLQDYHFSFRPLVFFLVICIYLKGLWVSKKCFERLAYIRVIILGRHCRARDNGKDNDDCDDGGGMRIMVITSKTVWAKVMMMIMVIVTITVYIKIINM